jgi:hypothetical protein
VFAPIKRIQTAAKLLVELRKLSGTSVIMFLQEPESFPDDFAR